MRHKKQIMENVSPNPIRRKLKQTTLCFSKSNGISIDTKTINTKSKPPMIRKKFKASQQKVDKISDDFVEILEPEVTPEPQVDPQLEDTPNDDDSDIIVIEDINLPLKIQLDLIEDCEDNNPTVRALKTLFELKEECISLDLLFDDQIIDLSDDETEQQTNHSKGGNFEVESIYDNKLESNVTLYYVKWKNYPEDDNTWEPITNLKNCRKLLDEYNHIRNGKHRNCAQRMTDYRNYYKLKAIIEDIADRKIASNVMTTILLIFNDIPLKDFHYTKNAINVMRIELREKCISKMDKISEMTNIERRVEQLSLKYNQLMDVLNITKRFESFDKFSQFFDKRKQLEFRLNRWEDEINATIVRQREGQSIRVENYIDCEIPPPAFEYISKCKTLDPTIIMSEEPPLYCECNDCETQSSECCVASYQSPINYTKNGVLKDSKNNRNAIYECNKMCKCSEHCINRVVQKGRKHKLAIFRTDDGKGWGVRALEPIHKGSYVMEYVGEIISVEEADRRGAIYDAEGRTYLFDLDYTPDVDGKYTLDATQCGNVSHFVNHSCDPNLDTRAVWVNNLDPFMPHIALFAVRNIRLNEELTFDYKINVHGITDAEQSLSQKDSTISSEKSYDSGIDGSASEPKPLRVECQCGAYNCRKFLY